MYRFAALSVLATSLSLISGPGRAQTGDETPSMIIAGECAPIYAQIVRYQYSFFNLTGTRLLTERAVMDCGGPKHVHLGRQLFSELDADLLEAAYRSQIKVP